MTESFNQLQTIFDDPTKMTVFILLLLWSFIWKGIALWKAGKNGQMVWFVAMFILNTVGILEILYIGFFQKKK
ncbi:hypothetical protein HZA39_02885 [Candidatus Peregrinibacteria bacterium]|nr:hypothetical protein [Candidatus Peregrinibacteria bacterium]